MKRTLKESIKTIKNMIGRIDHPTIIREQVEEYMDTLLQMGDEYGYGDVKDAMSKFIDTDNPAVKGTMDTFKKIKDGMRKWLETKIGSGDIPTMEAGDTWIDFWNKFTPEQQESFINTTGIDRETIESFDFQPMMSEQTSRSSGVDSQGNVMKVERTKPSFEFPPEIADEKDKIKRVWYCMQDRKNRGWNMSEDTYNRFYFLDAGIEGMLGGAGTDEGLVWMALAGSRDPEYKGKKHIPKGRIGKNQLQEMQPILACMQSDKPWEQNYMKENNLEGKNAYGWIMDDFSGVERCYLQAFLAEKGRGHCDDKHGYFWWNKAANWIKELF